jgi:geranylgeranyl diphosphate synthase, type II
MFDLTSYLETRRARIESALENYLAGGGQRWTPRIQAAMGYCLLSGGKRLRPALCLAAAEAVRGRADDVMPAACAIEMIHTYSLIHDDLPAMDNDDFRRGRATCHIAFGEAVAVLTGDALLTLAFEVLADPRNFHGRNDLSAERWIDAIGQIAAASGYRGMIEGQARDIAFEGRAIGLDQLKEMHALKTGKLIQAAVCCGAMLGGGSGESIRHLAVYGENIGLAFQVVDDLLNVQGDPGKLGKAVGTDATRGKTTYPSLIGTHDSRAYAAHLIDNALKALAVFDKNADPLRAMARYVLERQR